MENTRVIAKRSDISSFAFYKKGDTLFLKEKGTFVDYVGENLTIPSGKIYIMKEDIKFAKGRFNKKWIYFLGIPIFYTKERQHDNQTNHI